MNQLHSVRFPDESDEYREARNALLEAEIDLSAQIERVAQMRRTLPPGPAIKEDYTFAEGSRDLKDTTTVKSVRLSELFEGGRDTLILINFMFAPQDDTPCRMCNMWADGYNAVAEHLSQVVNFALVAKADIHKLRAWAAHRGWTQIRLLSSHDNTFNRDYLTETPTRQSPCVMVFKKDEAGAVRMTYSIEKHFVSGDGEPRHIDLYSPLWNLLDLTPNGRGTGWYPSFSYANGS